jgi:chromosome segregation ATPase
MATKKAHAPKAAEVTDAVKKMKPDAALADIASTMASTQKTLSELSATITTKLELVGQLDSAIELKKAELATLGQIDDAVAKLAEINEGILLAEKIDADNRAASAQARKREQEEYEYNLKRSRAAEADAYAVSIQQRNRTDLDARAKAEAELKARVDAVAARELKMDSLEKQVADIPNIVSKEVAKAEAVLKNVLKRDYETQAEIARINAESAAKVAQNTIENLEDQVNGLRTQIADLKSELSQANDRATAVATKALEAQSGKAALEAVQKAQEISASAQAKR